MYGKILRPHGSSYILLYFNNENKMIGVIYKSAMEEIGQIKIQKELFGKNNKYIFNGLKKKNCAVSTITMSLQLSIDISDGDELYFWRDGLYGVGEEDASAHACTIIFK